MKRKKGSIASYIENISKKDSIILFVTIIIIVLTLFIKSILLPQINDFIVKINEIDYLKTEEKKAEVAAKENITLESLISELKNKYNMVSSKLSKTPKVAQVVYDIEKLIKNNKLILVEVNVLENNDIEEEEFEEIERGIKNKEQSDTNNEREESIRYQKLDIQVTGTYKSIIDFIKAIEGYERICEVINVNIRGENGELNSIIRVKFYNLNFKETENYEFNINKYGKVNSFE